MEQLVLDDVRLTYRRPLDETEFLALEGVSLAVEQGEFVAIVGPSGCGKSTLLLLINGLLRPSSGRILLNGRPVSSPGPDRALVFQEFALLPWRTVLHNVELGLEVTGQSAAARRAIARDNLRLVGLSAFERYYPHQLSGGMRQRVGIARALAVGPEVLLMDEPFGALDAQTRQIMGAELLRIWERDRKTILFVTHDIDESIYLADRVVVMSANPGRVLEVMPITLPRPRDFEARNSPEFVEYRRRIWERLEQEVRKSLAWQFSEAASE
ncbi:MAG TPA: ABC transporter ATP-binding protein [Chloroflexota bacterium]|nr:ABC transporter ATP-binding protein [Chloroflexota bacterium]